MEKIYYLYEIGVGIPMYIGKTKSSLKYRLKAHKCSKGTCKRELWIQSVNSNIGIELIELTDNGLEREEYWTNFYKEKHPIVNLRIGNKASKELSEIFSIAQKKKKINWDAIRKTQQKNKGKKRSKEFCVNSSLRQSGVSKPIEHTLKMKQTQREKYGIKIKVDNVVYGSINEAVEKTKYTKSIITSYLKNRIKNRIYNIELA
jgi:hypothetical protein